MTQDDDFAAYKGYTLAVEVQAAGEALHGRIANITDIVTCHGDTPQALYASFMEAVDDYCDTCRETGAAPEAPCCGLVSLCLAPEIERRCRLAARSRGQSLEDWAAAVLARAADRQLPL